MKIIISPAKKMNAQADFFEPRDLPLLLMKTERLKHYLQALPLKELRALLCCNEQIAQLNFERLQRMDLQNSTVPAIFSYNGIQFQYMAPQVFTWDELDYISRHLRILSGFYGILRPFDGVVPYRLEMQTKLKTSFCSDLYDFWKDDIFRILTDQEQVILNLASNEYSKTVAPYLTEEIQMVTPVFGEWINGKVVEKGVYVKMARGEMVRFLAQKQITDVEGIKQFDRLGYQFEPALSNENVYVFLKTNMQSDNRGTAS